MLILSFDMVIWNALLFHYIDAFKCCAYCNWYPRLCSLCSTEQYLCPVRHAIVDAVRLSNVSTIKLQVFWFVRWWLWSKGACSCVVCSIQTVVRTATNATLVVSKFKIDRLFNCQSSARENRKFMGNNLPVWSQTDIIHQCIDVSETFQAGRWVIISILYYLHCMPGSMWPLNTVKLIVSHGCANFFSFYFEKCFIFQWNKSFKWSKNQINVKKRTNHLK